MLCAIFTVYYGNKDKFHCLLHNNGAKASHLTHGIVKCRIRSMKLSRHCNSVWYLKIEIEISNLKSCLRQVIRRHIRF